MDAATVGYPVRLVSSLPRALRELLVAMHISFDDIELTEKCGEKCGGVKYYLRSKIRQHQKREGIATIQCLYRKVAMEGLGQYVVRHAPIDGIPSPQLFFDTLRDMAAEARHRHRLGRATSEPAAKQARLCQAPAYQLGDLTDFKTYWYAGLGLCDVYNLVRHPGPRDDDKELPRTFDPDDVIWGGTRLTVCYSSWPSDEDDSEPLEFMGRCATFREIFEILDGIGYLDTYGFFASVCKTLEGGDEVMLITFGGCS